MNYEDGKQANTSDPDYSSMPRIVEPESIFVDRILAGEQEEVSDQVPGEEQQKSNTGASNQDFLPNRGVPEGENRTG